jgi:Lrp/AsnC family leucine-responsive transcriptional regulator
MIDTIDRKILDQLQDDASLSNLALADRVHVSPATCLRRVQRLRDTGLIERQVALLSHDRLAQAIGAGLTAIVEVTLERQASEDLDAFEARMVAADAVQQCYRVSPGPDFVLLLYATDMKAYQETTQALFTRDANVRNVKSFFSLKRAKFGARIPLTPATA